MEHIDWKKYLIAFIISFSVFITALYINNYFEGKKIENIKSIQDTIATDIMSSETQFSLLSELSCKDVSSSMLSRELTTLAEKIEYSEKNLNDKENISQLKKFYSLLEIKDYILMKRLYQRCGKNFITILYFYADKETCSECEKQGVILSYLREKYPEIRVYSFDYNLDLSAVKTLININKIKGALPSMVFNDNPINGFTDLETLEKMITKVYPKNAATSTPKTKLN